MYRRVPLLMVGSLVLPPAGAHAQVLQPSELCSVHAASAVATFEDAHLEARVRRSLPPLEVRQGSPISTHDRVGVPDVLEDLSYGGQGDLTCGMLSGLTDLNASKAPIESLVGIQNLTNLTSLNLDSGKITDISALSGLTSLTYLRLELNSITDIDALSGLTRLTHLALDRNSITDVSALGGLTSLTYLRLQLNSLTDISALSGLTGLTLLQLHWNSITDIGALSGLTSLTHLYLSQNLGLTDIQPLLDHRNQPPDASPAIFSSVVLSAATSLSSSRMCAATWLSVAAGDPVALLGRPGPRLRVLDPLGLPTAGRFPSPRVAHRRLIGHSGHVLSPFLRARGDEAHGGRVVADCSTHHADGGLPAPEGGVFRGEPLRDLLHGVAALADSELETGAPEPLSRLSPPLPLLAHLGLQGGQEPLQVVLRVALVEHGQPRYMSLLLHMLAMIRAVTSDRSHLAMESASTRGWRQPRIMTRSLPQLFDHLQKLARRLVVSLQDRLGGYRS